MRTVRESACADPAFVRLILASVSLALRAGPPGERMLEALLAHAVKLLDAVFWELDARGRRRSRPLQVTDPSSMTCLRVAALAVGELLRRDSKHLRAAVGHLTCLLTWFREPPLGAELGQITETRALLAQRLPEALAAFEAIASLAALMPGASGPDAATATLTKLILDCQAQLLANLEQSAGYAPLEVRLSKESLEGVARLLDLATKRALLPDVPASLLPLKESRTIRAETRMFFGQLVSTLPPCASLLCRCSICLIAVLLQGAAAHRRAGPDSFQQPAVGPRHAQLADG